MRILITGSRGWTNTESIHHAILKAIEMLNEIKSSEGEKPVDNSEITLIHGTAAGADVMAGRAAEAIGINIEEHPASWHIHNEDCPNVDPGFNRCHKGLERCKRAGHRRNNEMIDSGADVVLAFVLDNSPGTTGCLKNARSAGIPAIVTSASKSNGSNNVHVSYMIPGYDRHGEKSLTLF